MENGESSAPSARDNASLFSCRRETERRLEHTLRARGYLTAYDDEEDDMYVYDKGDEDKGDGGGDWRSVGDVLLGKIPCLGHSGRNRTCKHKLQIRFSQRRFG